MVSRDPWPALFRIRAEIRVFTELCLHGKLRVNNPEGNVIRALKSDQAKKQSICTEVPMKTEDLNYC